MKLSSFFRNNVNQSDCFSQQTVEQWRLVFLIAAANSIVGGIIYMIFGTSEEQPWNQYAKLNTKEQERLAPRAQELVPRAAVKRDNDAENADEKSKFIKER